MLKNNARGPKNATKRGKNHKIGNNSANMSILSLKIGQNLKTNWYTHFIMHFQHSSVSIIFLYSLKV